ncbi:transcriptional regulator [Pseudonocardia adelaidensis]|uniref:Response regulatory domain-containing protein n=1 Tax=Pseudonocardia adelaidensis TaxID=648754 RepID=A0ABP9P9W0_9PSEU
MIRILVVDDQALIRGGLVALFTAAPGLEVVGEAADGAEAVALAASGAEPPRIIVLTTSDLDEYLYTALGEGASGFLPNDTPPDRIISAVHTVAAGDILITPRITRRLVEAYAQHHRTTATANAHLAELRPREREILRLVGNGPTNAQIAPAGAQRGHRQDAREAVDGAAAPDRPCAGRRRGLRDKAGPPRSAAPWFGLGARSGSAGSGGASRARTAIWSRADAPARAADGTLVARPGAAAATPRLA